MDKIEALMKDLLDINSELYQKGYITPTGGNISARCPDDPEQVIITPAHLYKRTLTPEQMLIVDLHGKVLNDRKYPPTTEAPFHLAIFRARPDIKAVIHTHTIHTTIVGLTNMELLPVTAEAVMLSRLPIIPWGSGTDELGQQIVDALGKHGFFVVIQNHGLVVGGPTLQWASGVTDMIEVVCRILVTCKMMGIEPKVLPDAVIAAIQESAKKGAAVG
jgi:ribulose-5-phosphate 4-epimerase/fuculose-1-phosphate aldolase